MSESNEGTGPGGKILGVVTPRDIGFHLFIAAVLIFTALFGTAMLHPRGIPSVLLGVAGGMNIGVAFEYRRLTRK